MRNLLNKKVLLIIAGILIASALLFDVFIRMNIISLSGDLFDSITISNTTEKAQEVKFLVNKKLPFGSFKNIEELLSYVVIGAKTDEEKIKKIYDYFERSRRRFCSKGSHIEDVHLKENITKRLFSYPFACCSDVNVSIMYAYKLMGYKSKIIGNPRHMIGEVRVGNKRFIIDPDIGVFLPISFEEGKQSRFDFPNLSSSARETYASVFVDDEKLTWFGQPDDEGFALNKLPTLFPVSLVKGESITFNNKRTVERIVAYPEISKQTVEEYAENFKGVGTGELNRNLKHAMIENDGNCRIYEINSPYVIVESSVSGINKITLKELYFSIDKNNWIPIFLDAKNIKLDDRLNGVDKTFGRYQYFLKACPINENDFSFEDSIKVQTAFQYNRFLLPEKIKVIENLNPETTLEVKKVSK